MQLEIHTAKPSLEIKADADESGEFGLVTGWVTTFEPPENYDSYGDIVAPSFFEDSIREFRADSERKAGIKILDQHSHQRPVGLPEVMETVDGAIAGVRGVAAILKTIPDGDKVWRQARHRIVDSKSWGGYVLGFEELEDHITRFGWPVRRLTKGRIFEWSLVTFPANTNALVTDVRARQHTPLSRAIETRALQGEDPAYIVKQLAAAVRGHDRDVWALAAGRRQLDDELVARMASCLEVTIAATHGDIVKAGRVLSAKNHEKLAAAHLAIGEVLDAAQPADKSAEPPPPAEPQGEPPPEPDPGCGDPEPTLSDLLQRATSLAERMTIPHVAGA